MPGPRYEKVPLEEEDLPSNHYFTGLPSTAPPSFCTVPPSLPHLNDESAATIMPRSERPSPGPEQELTEIDDPPISLWGASGSTTTHDTNSTRDDLLMTLLDRMQRLEARLDAREDTKKEVGVEAVPSRSPRRLSRQWTEEELWVTCGIFSSVILVMFFIAAIIIIPAVAKYKYAGAMMNAAGAVATPDPS